MGRRRRGNGEGSIFRDTERNRWIGLLTLDGKRKKVTGRTRAEVAKRLAMLSANAERGIPSGHGNITVGQWCKHWCSDIIPATVGPRTAESYRWLVEHYVVPALGTKRLTKLTVADVSRMLGDMERAGYSANTRRLARIVLRQALRRAEREGHVGRNVAALTDGPRRQRTQGRTLTPEQARSLLEQSRDSDCEAPIALMLGLGLRRGEALGLGWSDVNLSENTVTIRRALKRLDGKLVLGETKTSSSRRTLHLPEPVVAILRRHRAAQAAQRLAAGAAWEDHDLVVATSIGTPYDPDNLNKRLSALCRSIGLGHWSSHELRHSAASLLLAMGVGLKVVSETLGHSSIVVTADVYSHLLADQRKEAAQAMSNVLRVAPQTAPQDTDGDDAVDVATS